MAFIVEDGTGLPTANSYASLAEFDAYWTDRNREDLADTDDEVKQAALITATDWIDLEQHFRGIKKILNPPDSEQALEWPREGVVDHHTRVLIDSNSLPVKLKNATIEAAAVAIDEELLPTASGSSREILSESVGAGPLRRSRTFAARLNSAPVPRKALAWLKDLTAGDEMWRA